MIINQNYEIDSCDDIELNIKRNSKLEFNLCYDNKKEIEALVCVIPGYGADISSIFYINEYMARNFNIAILSINYHCIGNRPQTGSQFFLDDIDKLILNESCKALGIQLPMNPFKIENYEQLNNIFRFINDCITNKKIKKEVAPNYFLNLHVSLQPKKNEYQNFGIMQAQDIINALLFIKNNPPFNIMGGVYLLS